MTFTIPFIPPTYNQHIHINYHSKQVYLTKKARDFKNKVMLFTPPATFRANSLFKLIVHIHYDWYYKNGKVRKLDIQNLDKLLIDAMCEKLRFDDCRIWDSRFIKVQDKNSSFTNVELREIEATP